MRKKYTLLYCFIILLFVFPFEYAAAQNGKSNPFHHYIKQGDTRLSFSVKEQKTPFFLVKENKETLQKWTKQNGSKIIRSLSEQYHIIGVSEKVAFEKLADLSNFWEANNQWKLSPLVTSWIEKKKRSISKKTEIVLRTQNLHLFKSYLSENDISHTILKEYFPTESIVIRLAKKTAFEKLLSCSQVLFIDFPKTPKEEASVSFHNLTFNKANLVHREFPELTAKNVVVSVKELLFDVDDIDLITRTSVTNVASSDLSQHATNMASIIGGAGNTSLEGKGAAWQTTLSSADFESIFPNDDSYFSSENISVQNHSYGIGIDNYYSAEAEAYDINTQNNPALLHIFSSGNSGEEISNSGIYAEIPNFANITGHLKMAKNNLLIGAIGADGKVDSRSSKGPTFDGRLKPELVAYGKGGTSESAAMVSGVSLLLQDFHLQKTQMLPSSALVKAVLIASADDVGVQGIDFQSGYGNVNAYKAVKIMENETYFSQSVNQHESKTIFLNIPQNTESITIALVWNDVAAPVNNATALVNDLDLKIQQVTTSETWLPWGLNTFAHPDSLSLAAVRKEDHLNNVEYSTINNPESGTYELTIKANNLQSASQAFSVAYQIVPKQNFYWSYPVLSDHLESNQMIRLQWESTLSLTNTDLEISLNNGNWKTIATNIDLSTSNWEWQVPDTVALAKLRFNDNGIFYPTETFTINPILNFRVGADCDDNFLLFWNKLPSITSYSISKLENGVFTETFITSDTSIFLEKNQYSEIEYAVTPIFLTSEKGLRSNSLNYQQQGVDCFFTGFFADFSQNGEAIALSLQLSSNLNIKSIHFEREINGIFQEVYATSNIPSLKVIYEDSNGLTTGLLNYRAKIILSNDTEIITNTAEIFYANPNDLLLFPNPISNTELLNILSKGDNLQFQLFNTQGKLILETQLITQLKQEFIDQLARGLYIYRTSRNGELVGKGKLVVH